MHHVHVKNYIPDSKHRLCLLSNVLQIDGGWGGTNTESIINSRTEFQSINHVHTGYPDSKIKKRIYITLKGVLTHINRK